MSTGSTIRGKFLSLEGLDGAGKTTQLELLTHWLDEQQIAYVRTREPGGTPLGREIRRLLLEGPELEISPLAEAFLFQADRAQHFAKLILPALAAGKMVISDRSVDASIAYQGFARNLGPELIAQFSVVATQGHLPDLTILLDLDSRAVQQRIDPTNDPHGVRQVPSRFDSETVAFHQRVSDGFRLIARAHPARIRVINAERPREEIHKEIVAMIKDLF